MRQEKGITGVDLTITIIIVMLFISVIASLFYNNYINSQAATRSAQANSYITNLFSQAERVSYADMTGTNLVNFVNNMDANKISASENKNTKLTTPYKVYITVTNYKDLPENAGKNLKDYVKKIEVEIRYQVGKQEQKKQFSTVKQIELK